MKPFGLKSFFGISFLGQRPSLIGRFRLSDLFSVLDNSILLRIKYLRNSALALSASADSASNWIMGYFLSKSLTRFIILSLSILDLKRRITAAVSKSSWE